MWISAPPFRFRCGRAALAPWTWPSRLTSITRANSCGVVRSNGATSRTPETCTQVSSRPYSVTARCATRCIWAGSVTSATSAVASPPSARISSTSERSPCSPRAATTTLAPSFANLAAVARPIPLDAPMTTTTCWEAGLSVMSGIGVLYPLAHRQARGPTGECGTAAVTGRTRRIRMVPRGPHAGPDMTLLALDRAGHGEPLLLLHGIGSTRDDFSGLFPRLAEEFDVLSVDLPGHGESPLGVWPPTVAALTDAVEADLDARGLDRVHVLGNSLGGRIGIELAVRHRTRSLVALSPNGLGLPPERFHQGMLMATARTLTRTLRPLIGTLADSPAGRAALLSGLRARPWEASRTEALAVRGGFADSAGFWSMLWWAVLQDVPTGLDRIDCPVALAQGADDLVGAGQTPRYLPLLPGSRFHLLPGAGHAPQSAAAETILALVRQTAARAQTPTGASVRG